MEHWHYSRCMPAGKTVKIGVWENDKFIGVVIFSRGANNNLFKPYGLSQTEACELTRIALDKHNIPVSRIVSIALKLLKQQSPGMRLVVSFADPEQGHHGGIYQGGGWVYVGATKLQKAVVVNGRVMHKRSASSKFGSYAGFEKSKAVFKHKYLMPMDNEIKARILPLSKPYPKRVKQATESYPDKSGGAALTYTLQG